MDIDIMERAFKEYSGWKSQILPKDLQKELLEMEDDKEEIYDCFCKDIKFGTSGLRGKMGVGTNRINSVVLRKATRGIAAYLTERYNEPEVVIGYDTRINSKEYAESVAAVFAEEGVSAVLFCEATPVPVVSFAVRYLGINGGIMITASHNPREYNGYKVYDHYGNQIDNNKAVQIEKYIARINPFEPSLSTKKGKVVRLDKSVQEAYHRALEENLLLWDERKVCKQSLGALSVCYTPLYGAGLSYVLSVLEKLGIGDVHVVQSQKEPDGNFPTCPSPNPEINSAFAEALRQCSTAGNCCDIILATDPDSDRLGVMVRTDGGYTQLSGNQVGELMFDYVLRCHSKGIGGRSLRGEKIAYKSYVSTPLVEEMGRAYSVEVKNVFTGFKNIVLEIEKLKAAGKNDAFLFGFEESLGYLYGDYTRDKDGIMAAQMVCLMAAEQKRQGKTLIDQLNSIYEKYGYIESVTQSMVFKNEKERAVIDRIVTALFDRGLRKDLPAGYNIKKEICYRLQKMYCAEFENGHRIIIRPSGTELKLKIYIFARGVSSEEAINAAALLGHRVRDVLEGIKNEKCLYSYG